MNLLGLDLASRSTGWCCGDGSAVPECGAWAFPQIDGDYGLLLATLDDYLNVVHARFGFTHVAYEAPLLITRGRRGAEFQDRSFGDTLGKLRLLYPLGAFTEYWCLRRGVECFEVSVAAIKSEVTGNHRAEKGEMVAHAAQCGLALPTTGADDAADAWGAWLVLLRHQEPARWADWAGRIHTSRGGLL